MEVFQTRDKWEGYSPKKLEQYKQLVFDHYRENGFPYYPEDHEWRLSELESAKKYDFTRCIDHDNKLIRQSMHGLSLCWSYHPYHYGIRCNTRPTVEENFLDDEILMKVIDKCIKHRPRITDSTLRKSLKMYCAAQCVSNFRPTAAAAIYTLFCNEGDFVFDMSVGFGGRCLGAHLAGVNYLGVDPSTRAVKGVSKMIDDLDIDAKIKLSGSEFDTNLPDNSIDFCFTSPPYFDCEKYAEESTQSYLKYPTKEEWLAIFLRRTLQNCSRILKKNKYLVLNIADVQTYPNLVSDATQIAVALGYRLEDMWGLHLSNMAHGGFKSEPILVFKNCKLKPSRKHQKFLLNKYVGALRNRKQ